MARKQKPHVTSEPPIDLAENLGVFRLMADGWSTLILREIFFGTNRFGELQRALSIAPGMLTNRLAGLVDEGVVGRRQYRPDKPWYEYELTDKGQKFAPAWIMMARLADVKYGAPEGEKRDVIHSECGQNTDPILCCSACMRAIAPGTLTSKESLAKDT